MDDKDQQIEALKRLVLSLAEKLHIVAQHLAHLAERKDKRNA